MSTLTLQQAAALLKIHPVTLQDKARTGVIPGAKIGKCWVFVEVDLLDYIRSQYPRRALQGEHERNITCHSSNAKTRLFGGSNLPTTEAEYSKALGLRTKQKPSEYHDKLRASLWDQARLGVRPSHTWNDAVVRWSVGNAA